MGATTFWVKAKGKTMNAAFQTARDQALYEHGHGGYTGTIAEKPRAVRFDPPAGVEPMTFLEWIETFDHEPARKEIPAAHRAAVERAWKVYDDKWGPAVGVQVAPGTFVFLGWASE